MTHDRTDRTDRDGDDPSDRSLEIVREIRGDIRSRVEGSMTHRGVEPVASGPAA